MLALVGAVMSRSSAGNVLLGHGDRVLGTHRGGQVEADPVDGVALGGVDATGEGEQRAAVLGDGAAGSRARRAMMRSHTV